MSQNPVARGNREPSKKVADAIDWTREKVEDMTKRGNVKKGKPPLPCGQYYLVKPVPKKGADSFVWESLSREEAEGKLSCLSKHALTCLNQDTFKKVSPAWLQVVFQSFNNVHTVVCPLYVRYWKVTYILEDYLYKLYCVYPVAACNQELLPGCSFSLYWQSRELHVARCEGRRLEATSYTRGSGRQISGPPLL